MRERLLPARAQEDMDLARKRLLTTGILLSFLTLTVGTTAATWLWTGRPPSAFTLGIAAVLALCYGLSRRGPVRLTAIIAVALVLGILTANAFTTTQDVVGVLIAPMLLVIPIGLAGVLISWRAVPLTAGLVVVEVVWLYLSKIPPLIAAGSVSAAGLSSTIIYVLVMFAAMGTLAVLSGRQIEQVLARLDRRNLELEAANHDLAQQMHHERELGANIGDLAGTLAVVSRRQVTGVSNQAQAINQVVSAVAELHDTAYQIATLAQAIRTVADQALANVQQGQDMLARSQQAIQRNQAQVEQVITGMHSLERLTSRIASFVGNIRTLSEETHLLALNATIEAAGAGTLGRRFAVVAAEVQTLATRANSTVDDIQALIGELQAAGEGMLATTRHSVVVADEVVQLADDVRGTQEQLSGAVERTTDLVHQISAATAQQTAATEQMAHTMREIADIADSTSQDTTALERVTRELLGASNLLTSALAHLRLQGGAT